MTRTEHHVVVVGAGGNIGSHLVPHLARMPDVGHVSLIDRDVYDASNVAGQDIRPRDVGAKKAVVQARRLRAIRPGLRVTTLAEAVENVPLGSLRADVVLGCLDSRRARQHVNQAVIFLGTPWIDAGVSGNELLARIAVYHPAKRGPCLECPWDDTDYAAVNEEYPCTPRASAPTPTAASSSLGALAASLQAIECRKRLSGDTTAMPPGTRVLVDARHAKLLVTTYDRNPSCRLPSHAPRQVSRARATTASTLGEAFGLARSSAETVRLGVEGKSFVRALACSRCATRRRILRLSANVEDVHHACRRCGRRMFASGLDTVETIALSELTARTRERTLFALGFRAGEIVTLSDNRREKHFVISRARKKHSM